MNKKVLFLVNHDLVIYNFRKELVLELLKLNYEVYISSPYGKKIDYFVNKGCKFVETKVNRHGLNIVEDLKLLKFYKKIINEIKPLVVLTYTIKPNIYGGHASKRNAIPYIANITGLGSALENRSIVQLITVFLYRRAFSKIHTVFFQNEENKSFFKSRKIAIGKHVLIPGSGVNTDDYIYQDYPIGNEVHFAFISRIMKEKGIELFLDTAERIKNQYPNTFFHVCGFCEQEYMQILDNYSERGIIVYHGMIDNVNLFLRNIHCLIHPTNYPEGISNILLEAQSSGRPVITTNRPGCAEAIIPEKTGFLMKNWTKDALYEQMIIFLSFDVTKWENMGHEGRLFVQKNYNRTTVINEYIKKIKGMNSK